MKKLNMSGFAGITAAAILAVVGLASTANAQLINLTFGDFTINANGYSATDLPTNGFNAPGAYAGEDTWGIFQINTITQGGNQPNAQTIYTSDQAPANGYFQYYGVFYGSHDVSATTVGTRTDFVSQGLQLAIYAHAVDDRNSLYWTQVYNQGASQAVRGVQSGYNLITNGSLVLQASAIGDTEGTYRGGSLNTTFNTGNLNVTLNSLFNVPPGNTLSPLTYALSGVTTNVPSNWSVSFGGPITGNVVPVPEPSTYGLIAAGALLGLVAFRRMKVRAQAV